MLKVISDVQASHLGGGGGRVVTLLVILCLGPCDGLTPHKGGVVWFPRVWGPCDGLASHAGD